MDKAESKKQDKESRRAAALRENLRRRKAQSKERTGKTKTSPARN